MVLAFFCIYPPKADFSGVARLSGNERQNSDGVELGIFGVELGKMGGITRLNISLNA